VTTVCPSRAAQLAALPLRAELRGTRPYGAPQLVVPVRLNNNENPYPPPPALVADLTDAVSEIANGLNRYPDREAIRLRAGLAAYLGVDPDQVWAANGSNEVLAQLLQAFGGPGRSALGFVPSYSMHPLIARLGGTRWMDEPRREDFTVSAEQANSAVVRTMPDVVFLTRPNNPTGTPMALSVVKAVCECAPGIVIVDEAYAEFSTQTSAITLLERYPRLIVTRTMSKAFALAGARVGYLAAAPAVIDALQLVRLPYHLSALTQAAALAALRHTEQTLATVRQVCADRDRLAAALRATGLKVGPSDANFMLFGRFDRPDEIWQGLLDRGVLVRDVGLPRWLRVSVGTTAECELFLAALTQVMP